VQLLTLTSDFIAPVLWPAKSPDLNPVDYKIWGKLQERVYRSRIRDIDTLKSHLIKSGNISNEAVRQWCPRLLACIRAHGGTQTLSVFDICTNVHFDGHISVWLPLVDTYVLGDLTKPDITTAGVDRFYLNLAFCLQLDFALLLQNLENPTLFE